MRMLSRLCLLGFATAVACSYDAKQLAGPPTSGMGGAATAIDGALVGNGGTGGVIAWDGAIATIVDVGTGELDLTDAPLPGGGPPHGTGGNTGSGGTMGSDGGIFLDAASLTECGDGVMSGPETCDDGNTVSWDGCSSTCQLERGWTCRVAGAPCSPLCGDGVLTASETCDDGNTASGDGCSSTCQLEPGWGCTGSPEVCTKAVCGNGIVEVGEPCDCGNDPTKLPTGCKGVNGVYYGNGSGCSNTCTKEPIGGAGTGGIGTGSVGGVSGTGGAGGATGTGGNTSTGGVRGLPEPGPEPALEPGPEPPTDGGSVAACANATPVSGGHLSMGTTNAFCFVTCDTIQFGWGCNSFTSVDRVVKVNGTSVTCGGTLPAKKSGYYYFEIGAGGETWDSISWSGTAATTCTAPSGGFVP